MTFQDIINSNQPVLVDFFATWCGPCQTLSPILKEVADELKGEARVLKIDVDKNKAVAQKYQIMGVPTMMVFKNGETKWRQSGVLPKSEIVKIVKQFM